MPEEHTNPRVLMLNIQDCALDTYLVSVELKETYELLCLNSHLPSWVNSWGNCLGPKVQPMFDLCVYLYFFNLENSKERGKKQSQNENGKKKKKGIVLKGKTSVLWYSVLVRERKKNKAAQIDTAWHQISGINTKQREKTIG